MVLDASLDAYRLQAARDLDKAARTARLNELKRALAANEMHLIEHEVGDFLDRNKLLAPEGSAERSVLVRKMMRAEIEAVTRTLERDEGDYTGTPSDPVVKPAVGRAAIAKPGERILDLFDRYMTENPRGSRTETLQQARGDVETFVQFVGANAGAEAITKKTVRDFKAVLMKLPTKAREAKVFRGMNLQQIIKANETHKKPVLSSATVNRYLSSLSAFATWLAANDYLETNPLPGMTISTSQTFTRDTFSTEELVTLFRSPLFTGCRDDIGRKLAEPGNLKIRDYRYWLPLIMLYTGARPGEIAQLDLADVREDQGIPFLHIHDEGEGKSLKTKNSTRIMPLHPELIRLGVLAYRDEMKSKGETRLFPTAKRSEKGQMIADWSRAFPKYLCNIGVRTDQTNQSLYSFRHGAADALRRAGYLDHQFKFLLGHGDNSMTGRYGNLPQGMLQQRAEIVAAIDFPGLDLSHLHSPR